MAFGRLELLQCGSPFSSEIVDLLNEPKQRFSQFRTQRVVLGLFKSLCQRGDPCGELFNQF